MIIRLINIKRYINKEIVWEQFEEKFSRWSISSLAYTPGLSAGSHHAPPPSGVGWPGKCDNRRINNFSASICGIFMGVVSREFSLVQWFFEFSRELESKKRTSNRISKAHGPYPLIYKKILRRYLSQTKTIYRV